MNNDYYKVLDNERRLFRLSIHADVQTGDEGFSALTLLCGTIFSFSILALLAYGGPGAILMAGAAAVWVIGGIYRLIKGSPPTEQAVHVIEITPEAVKIGGAELNRRDFQHFYECHYQGDSLLTRDHIYQGIAYRWDVKAVRLHCSFRSDKAYKRDEVIRLLNNALQRIPPSSAFRSAANTNTTPAAVIGVFL